MIVRRAVTTDAAALAELGARTFADTFAAHNRAEDMEAYLARTYGEALQLREIGDPAIVTLVVEDDDALIAFAQLRDSLWSAEAAAPPLSYSGGESEDVPALPRDWKAEAEGLRTPNVELARFYVDRGQHGRGIAQVLMDAVIDAVRELGGATLWLGVWEHNARAIRFYEKYGFRDVGAQPFLLGSDLQTDRVMTFVIPPR